jgi:glycosyltransferase involved in cell wall biosynthesis
LVTVVIPTYNSARFLPAALASVFLQKHPACEIIAVDDGSTDDTLALLGRESRVTVLEQAHGGVSSARNAGIAAARGEIVAFLDSDDVWPAGRLAAGLEVFDARPDVGALLGMQMLFLEPHTTVPRWVKPEWLTEPQPASNTAVLMARREVFDRVGSFDTSYEAGEDTEWMLRARQAGVVIERLPRLVVHKRLHGGNLSLATLDRRRETLARIARESIRRQHRSGA